MKIIFYDKKEEDVANNNISPSEIIYSGKVSEIIDYTINIYNSEFEFKELIESISNNKEFVLIVKNDT